MDTFRARLDPELAQHLDERQASKIVAKTELLKLAAKAPKELDLLEDYLWDECDVLIENGILPRILPLLYKAAVVAPGFLRGGALFAVELALSGVCDELKIPLEDAMRRRWPDY